MKCAWGLLLGCLLATAVQAEVHLSKDWVWTDEDTSFSFAGTVNEDKRSLAQFCYYESDTCYYMVVMGLSCDTGSIYPALINSDVGAYQVDLLCAQKTNSGKDNVFIIKPFDDIDNAVRNANSIGFAMALESGYFKVVRFSLNGSTNAINQMRQHFIENNSAKPQKPDSREPQGNHTGSEHYL